MNAVDKLIEMLERSKRIAFLGGAGVSTESGIPDFRSEKGVYRTVKEYGVNPETILSDTFFYSKTEVFYDYYKKYMLFKDAQPNDAHRALAELERQGRLSAVVTQNIDGLHQKAGSKRVLELHGSVLRNSCLSCGKRFDMEYIINSSGVPRCECGGLIKPDVVLYGEGLDARVLRDSVEAISSADMLIIGGTSLTVYPAAGLKDYFSGDRIAVINMSPTPGDDEAALVIREPIGRVLKTAVLDRG